jgi:hypothetical protein
MNSPVEQPIPGFPPTLPPNWRSKFYLATQALQLFVRDPRSAGLGVGLQFFPNAEDPKACTSDADCTGGQCDHHSFCVGPTLTTYAFSLTECDPAQPNTCPAGATCKPGGICALNRWVSCPVDGQPCNIGRGAGFPNAVSRRDDVCRVIPTGKYCSPRIHSYSCDPGDYERPMVPIADLPGNERLLSGTIDGRVTNFGPTPGTLPALKAGLAHLRKRQAAHPDRKPVLVLVIDHIAGASGCDSDDVPTIAGEIAAARVGTPAIPTYVVGIYSSLGAQRVRPHLDALTMAGSAGMPIMVQDDADLTTQLHEALADIRGTALPCEFAIPPATSGRLDYRKVNMQWKGTAGPEETVPYVESADRCDPTRGGWHYDVPPMPGTIPSRVVACAASCRQFRSDFGGTVRLGFGCATPGID